MGISKTENTEYNTFELKIPKGDEEFFRSFINKMGWEITGDNISDSVALNENLQFYAIGLLSVFLYPLMFRVLPLFHSRIPHIKFNLYMRDYKDNEYILKSTDNNSLLAITQELEEPELKTFAAKAKEISIVYYCDKIIHFNGTTSPGFRLYVRLQMQMDGFYIPLIDKQFPYGEEQSERDTVQFAIKIGKAVKDAYDNNQSGVIEV